MDTYMITVQTVVDADTEEEAMEIFRTDYLSDDRSMVARATIEKL
jgi:hypothetical protein